MKGGSQTSGPASVAARCFAIALTALLLSSCGFQLRGKNTTSDTLPTVQLHGDSHSLLYQAVVEQLRASGNTLVEDGAEATVKLLSGGIRRRAASLNERGKTEEYELLARLRFEVIAPDGNSLSGPVRIESSRTYLYDENNVNAMQAEERLLKQELRSVLANQVVRRLRALFRGAGKRRQP